MKKKNIINLLLLSEVQDTDTDIDLDPGNDPDAVGGEEIPERALEAVGAKPGVKHEGSVKPLVEGQKDLEIASIALNSSQVRERNRCMQFPEIFRQESYVSRYPNKLEFSDKICAIRYFVEANF